MPLTRRYTMRLDREGCQFNVNIAEQKLGYGSHDSASRRVRRHGRRQARFPIPSTSTDNHGAWMALFGQYSNISENRDCSSGSRAGHDSPFRGSETLAVLPRSDPDHPLEGAAHGLDTAETAPGGDRLERRGRVLQHLTCGLDPNALDEPPWRGESFLQEQPRQLAFGHRRTFGEPRQAMISTRSATMRSDITTASRRATPAGAVRASPPLRC